MYCQTTAMRHTSLNMFHPPAFPQILHSLKPCWCLHSAQTSFIFFEAAVTSQKGASSVISHNSEWRPADSNVSTPWHAVNTSCYHDAASLYPHTLCVLNTAASGFIPLSAALVFPPKKLLQLFLRLQFKSRCDIVPTALFVCRRHKQRLVKSCF